MSLIIRHAESQSDIKNIKKLFNEYVLSLGENLDFQGFESELASLPGVYSPPAGTLLIALDNGNSAGCAALKMFGNSEDKICEMKRLYVKPEFRGKSLGKKLALMVIEEAISKGYCTMYLDTLERLKAAMHIYSSLGFTKTEPYYNNPIIDAVFWKLDLYKFKQNYQFNFS